MLKKKIASLAFGLLAGASLLAQTGPDRWQQAAKYYMEIDMDTKKHQFDGKQKLVYTNNSPDTLRKVFYHLYFNAFQPGSMMDERSRTLPDPDPRVGDRIAQLKPKETGYHKIKSLLQDGKKVNYEMAETILEVELAEPILPGASTTLEMEFKSQVPIQIRRSGRNSKEGIDYSMSQWYPKLCEYDYQGWHANPYIGREFHGVWGDFDVKITLPVEYTVGATGYLQNPNEMGHGYEDVGQRADLKGKKRLSWHFIAPNVHDFVWGADPDYIHDVVQLDDTTKIHFLYQDDEDYKATWKAVQPKMKKAFEYIEKRFGNYPYRQYSFIQGGDGGMEYPMATLITGNRAPSSLQGVMVHELMHTWYQMLMGTNEALYAWMDEGFTSYSTNIVTAYLDGQLKKGENPHYYSYAGYKQLAKSGVEEPLSTHADHFMSNAAYGAGSYNKGAVFVHQLEYIVGEKVLKEAMLDYYYNWRFKHPNPNDFIRIVEKRSGLELDWYREYWVNSTHTIDYAIDKVEKKGKKTLVQLQRLESKDKKTGIKNGRMPMPVDLVVKYMDGKEEKTACFHIPLAIMRGAKANENMYLEYNVMPDWRWTHTSYELELPIKQKDILSIEIDPSSRMADINRKNNTYKPD